jgi:uncharacterized membrane protein
MPPAIFLIFELGIYALALVCLRHAWPRGWSRRFGLVSGMCYGVLLEYAAILNFHAYSYGHFAIMIFGSVPLCIGVSWGLIIYTAMETSDQLALPWYLRPIVDALLALTVDLSMDAIAIRLGFWTWAERGQWFGVPVGNFYAWFVVVLGFSLLLRLGRLWSLEGRRVLLGDIVAVALAIPLAVQGLTALLQPYFGLIAQGASAWVIVGTLIGASSLLTVWAALRTPHDQPLDLVLLGVPVFFHTFFFAALIWAGIYRQLPALIVISAFIFVAGLALHFPLRRTLASREVVPPVI